MAESVYFCCGLALGVVLGASLWSGALYMARLAAAAAHRKQMAEFRQQAIAQQKRIEKAKQDLRVQYGNEMTPEQERIMEQELGKIYQDMPNPQIPKGS